MGDTPMENLIDFNIEETPSANCDSKTLTGYQVPLLPLSRLILENNPFDLIQKQAACRPDDPFDIVEKEATLKARHICSKGVEVKLGKLLSLSQEGDSPTACTVDSNAFYTAEEHDLGNESPPISFNSKWSPCSSAPSCDSSDSNKDQACGVKSRKTRNQRNRLLKLSISNAAFSTPNTSRLVLDKDTLKNDIAENLAWLSGDNEESSLDSESPVKLIDEELKLVNSKEERDYEHDLEMMEIPMLRQLASPEKLKDNKNFEEQDRAVNASSNAAVAEHSEKSKKLPNLEALRQKLRAKKLKSDNQDISEIISTFKNLLSECKIVDDRKKSEVDGIFETLTCALSAATMPPKMSQETLAPTESQEDLLPVSQETSPTPVSRQGTFDIELQENNQLNEEHTIDIIGQPAAIENMPNLMAISSATYDGEEPEDKSYLNLPQIDPLSPENKQLSGVDIDSLLEQLKHFLVQQQASSDSSESSNASGTAPGSNPTYIVVVPTIAKNSISNEPYDSGYGQRRRSQSLSIHDKVKIFQLPIKPMPEIKFNEAAYESSHLNASNIYDTPVTSDFKTPARFSERRNSCSSASPLTTARLSRLSQCGTSKDRSSSVMATTPLQQRKFGFHSESQQSFSVKQSMLGMKPDPRKKVMATSSLVKSNAPLKATLPFKQIAPNAKSTIQSNVNMRSSNTSMHLVAKAGHINHTSTPMTLPRKSNVTSNHSIAPTSPSGSTLKSMRYSNIATTPIGKNSSVPTHSTANLRRKTMTEFKSKSPNLRKSISNMSNLKTNISNLKTNLNRALSNASRNTSRLTVGGSVANPANPRNKENKPRN